MYSPVSATPKASGAQLGHSWDTGGSVAPAQGCTKCSLAAASEDQDRDAGARALHGGLCDLSQHFLSRLREDGAADMSLLPEEHPAKPSPSHPT